LAKPTQQAECMCRHFASSWQLSGLTQFGAGTPNELFNREGAMKPNSKYLDSRRM